MTHPLTGESGVPENGCRELGSRGRISLSAPTTTPMLYGAKDFMEKDMAALRDASRFPTANESSATADLCDACVRIDVALLDPHLDSADRLQLQSEKAMHLDAAIDQRRAMSAFVKGYAAAHAPNQQLPEEIVIAEPNEQTPSDLIDHDQPPVLQIQIEDFGGSFSLPFYGSARPSCDYFNSNLSIHNFVIADITNNINNVMLYDERGQGKGADALCSLRLDYHLKLRKRFIENGIQAPQDTVTLLLILDNCVGQNKSKQVFSFFAMLSIVFYKKVTLLYLLPGHSHNAADRVVAWCKNKMNGENLYCPEEIARRMNEVKSVRATFLDHRSATRPFFCGWSELLGRYFGGLPTGYTSNYFFEIDFGVVSMRHLVTALDEAVQRVSLFGNGDVSSVRRAVIEDLFAAKCLDLATMDDLRLERQLNLTLPLKKCKSLALKYESIPACYRSYFPTPKDGCQDTEGELSTAGAQIGVDGTAKKRAKKTPGVEPPLSRPPGRPSKSSLVTTTPSHRSILSFLSHLHPATHSLPEYYIN